MIIADQLQKFLQEKFKKDKIAKKELIEKAKVLPPTISKILSKKYRNPRLGRSTSEIIELTASLLKSKIKLIVIKQNLVVNHDRYDMNSKIMITFFSLFAELERDLVSLRTTEALKAKKASGIKLGKPVGTIQKSKFDKDIDKLKELLKLGLSVRKIAKYLGYSNHLSLNKYLNRRKLKMVS